MNQIAVELKSFVGIEDVEVQIAFSQTNLIHAAIGAGRNWRRRAVANTAFDITARTAGIRSIVDFKSAKNIRASSFYHGLGSTEKGTKSFQLGNAICALIAEKQLHIPWLVDLERLSKHPSQRYQVHVAPGKRRADFIGRTISGEWYAFESKGRTGTPVWSQMLDWKKQAKTVRAVNGKPITNNIVSATFVDGNGEIRAIWEDPPAEEDGKIEIPELVFLESYYEGIFNLLDSSEKIIEIDGSRLKHFPDLGISVGIHQQVEKGLQENDAQSIFAFARRQFEPQAKDISGDAELTVFTDGILIKLDSDWRPE